MIRWVNKKYINTKIIQDKINDCLETRHFTNYGKDVLQLQQKIKKIFKIDESKEVILVNNGASGLQALVGGFNTFFNKKLRYACQAFTFPCSKQGLLIDSIVLDIDENMGPNLKELNKIKDEIDAVIVTNCFGCSVNIQAYEKFCKDNNKILLFDNAASSYTQYNDKNILNYGDGCMVSLHHTKAIGFGEGGFIVFDKKYLDIMNRMICFGYSFTDKHTWLLYGSNFKMSEINAIYIDSWLDNLEKIYLKHTQLIKYFIAKKPENVELFRNYSNYSDCLNSCIPVLYKHAIKIDKFSENNIEAKKYYYPLDTSSKVSKEIFDNIICLPLNLDMTYEDIDKYINLL